MNAESIHTIKELCKAHGIGFALSVLLGICAILVGYSWGLQEDFYKSSKGITISGSSPPVIDDMLILLDNNKYENTSQDINKKINQNQIAVDTLSHNIEGTYIAKSNGRVYYPKDCSAGKSVLSDLDHLTFKSEKEAQATGLTLSKQCD